MQKGIRFSYEYAGFTADELNALAPGAQQAASRLHSGAEPFTGWVEYPKNAAGLLEKVVARAKTIRAQCTAFVVIGIGGSYLGAKACLSMLQSNFENELPNGARKGPKIYFAGHLLSGAYYKELLALLENEEVALCVISKSGKTLEASVGFTLIKDLLIKKYGKEGAAARITAITDAESGLLRAETQREGYESFVLPEDIGGRYSVLTPVGMLPAAVAGLPVAEILAGALSAYNDTCAPFSENPCYQYAAARQLLAQKGKKMEVYEVYEPKLAFLNEWLKQLYGESEGKEGKGLFPASVQFTTDLHSLGQFLQEGTPLFFETLLSIDAPDADLTVTDPVFAPEGTSMFRLNKIVEESAFAAHVEAKTPSLVLSLPDMTPQTFGYLAYFFEKSCGVSCYMAGVNPFDQPGVEAYKKNTRALLGL